MQNIYLLKDLAKISGHSTHALKYYLRLGLLKEIGRSPETNFRYFDDGSCEHLKKIRKLQKEKMSLKQIQEHLNKESNADNDK
ncbi:MAG: helix-turn-helix domain-containing protein [Candidatus Zapsychrus exili]|nr:helix-turn-helix domain-containing protein [Candidatus Zapsychrus exili]